MKIIQRINLNNKSLILVVVSILTQILPILISPIFSRIYSPEQFGEFSIILSYSAICVIFFSGKYELALLIPKYDIDIKSIFRLCLLIILFCVITSIVIVLIYLAVSFFFGAKPDPIFILVPFYTLLVSLYQILSYLLLYLKRFKELSINRLIKSVATVMLIAMIGLFFKGINGLIIGSFIGQLISIILCFYLVDRTSLRFKKLLIIRDLKKLRLLSKTYINFPKFSLPADMINAVVSQAPLFILSIYFTKTVVGYYGFVLTVVHVPIAIVASAVLDIFKEKATREFKELGNCVGAYKKTFLLLLGINVIPLLIISLWGPEVFKFVFGSQWQEAGIYAQIMIGMFFIKFLSSPLSYTFILMGKQKLDLYLHMIIFIMLFISIFLGVYLKLSVISFLILISIVFALIYLVYILKSYQYAKGYVKTSN
ncbi:MAG: lipopolysaccharide biosynthesis protein [Bacteroidota bacterium]